MYLTTCCDHVPHLLKNVRNNFQKTAGSLLADLGHACTPGTLCVIDKSFKPVYKPCMKMLENRSVADELNSLNKSNIRGHVDESELRLLINDYFAGYEDVDSELSDNSDNERDDSETNSLLQPACTDSVSVRRRLMMMKQMVLSSSSPSVLLWVLQEATYPKLSVMTRTMSWHV